MEIIERAATAQTPYINFDPKTGYMIVKGRVIPESSDAFWTPIVKWFYAYSFAPSKKTILVFQIDYFNISSSKNILFLLHKMNELYENGFDAIVQWEYAIDDEEMKEVGIDFSCVVNVPFEFVVVDTEMTNRS